MDNRKFIYVLLGSMILYEDNHLLIVNKLPGELVQGDHTGDEPLIERYKKYLKVKYDKPGNVYLHPVHRLDRPVSGCLILGRTSLAVSRLTKAFRENQVVKTYYALSDHQASERSGRIQSFLLKDQSKNKTHAVNKSVKGAKNSILSYNLVGKQGDVHIYQINPVTGRSHQIRVQLSSIGCPIIGDVKYGGCKIDNKKMIYLHCAQLSFIHPTRKNTLVVSCQPEQGKLWKKFIEILDSQVEN